MIKESLEPYVNIKEYNEERKKANRKHSRVPSRRTLLLLCFIGLLLTGLVLQPTTTCSFFQQNIRIESYGEKSTTSEQKIEPNLIFIEGPTGVGVDLMHKLLNRQSNDVWCGSEAGVVTTALKQHRMWNTKPAERKRLVEAKVGREVQTAALKSFLSPILESIGKGFPHICIGSSDIMEYSLFIHELFPSAKFLFMVRDGRQTVHEMVMRKERKLNPSNSTNDLRSLLVVWNANVTMQNQYCQHLGPKLCMTVKVEDLINSPVLTMNQVLKFLNLQPAIGEPRKRLDHYQIHLLKKVSSWTASHHWSDHIPQDVVRDFNYMAPMLKIMNYTTPSDPFLYFKLN